MYRNVIRIVWALSGSKCMNTHLPYYIFYATDGRTDMNAWTSVWRFWSLLARACGRGQFVPAKRFLFAHYVEWSVHRSEPTRWQRGLSILMRQPGADTDKSIKWASVWNRDKLCAFASRTLSLGIMLRLWTHHERPVKNGFESHSVTFRQFNLDISCNWHSYLYEDTAKLNN